MIKHILKKILPDISKNQRYDRLTKKIIRIALSEKSCCIDIGAHKGAILKLFHHYAPKGDHWAFEPIPDLYNTLKPKFPVNCSIYNIALSDVKGKSTFHHVVSNPAYSGLKKREYSKIKEKISIIEVNTDLLDNLIPESQKIDFIKIDVEGAELLVIKGGIKTIIKNKPLIVFEHGKGASDYYGSTPEELFDLLSKDCGMKIGLLQDWLKQKLPLSREAFIEQYEKKLNYYFIAF